MAQGTVKWFNPTKGYGFIKPDDGGQDVFVHISAVEKAGYTNLAEGARISFEVTMKRGGKMSAENLRLGRGTISKIEPPGGWAGGLKFTSWNQSQRRVRLFQRRL